MKIEIDFDRETYVQASADFLKRLITFSYRWLTNEGEALGYILGSLHFTLFVFVVLLVIVSHTIYPNFWLQFSVFILIFLIWVQHIVLKVCVSTVAEEGLTNGASPYHTIFEKVFLVRTSDFINYYAVAETTALGFFGLSLISRVSVYMHGWSPQL